MHKKEIGAKIRPYFFLLEIMYGFMRSTLRFTNLLSSSPNQQAA